MSGAARVVPMRADFDGVMQLVARQMYATEDAFVREYLQNASDAIHRRGGGGQIRVERRPERREIVFRDDGIGMSRQEIDAVLPAVGVSGTARARAALRERGAEEAEESLVGHFGIGILSALLVADRILVRTRRSRARHGWEWEYSGGATARVDLLELPVAWLHGVIDSPDLQPTPSRSDVRRDDPAYGALREQITARVIDHLRERARSEPDAIAALADRFPAQLRQLAKLDGGLVERLGTLLPFPSSRGTVRLHDVLPERRSRRGFKLRYLDSTETAPAPWSDPEAELVVFARGDGDVDLLRQIARRGRFRLERTRAERPLPRVEPLASGELDDWTPLIEVATGALERTGTGPWCVRAAHLDTADRPAVLVVRSASLADRALRSLSAHDWEIPGLAEATRAVLGQRSARLELLLNSACPAVRNLLEVAQRPGDSGRLLDAAIAGAALSAVVGSELPLATPLAAHLRGSLDALLGETAHYLAREPALPGLER